MFNTTHDAVLLVLAGLYVLVALTRAIQVAGGRFRAAPGALTLPLWIAAILALVAVFW